MWIIGLLFIAALLWGIAAGAKRRGNVSETEMQNTGNPLDKANDAGPDYRMADLENQVKSLKRKLSDNEQELVEMEQDNYRSASENKRLKDDLSAERKQNAKCLKENDYLRSSLSFVQEILSSHVSDDDMTRQMYAYVHDMRSFITRDLRDAVVAAGEISPEMEDMMFGSGLDIWSASARKTWLRGKTTIAFVGEFTAGKTTIVNKILLQDDKDAPQMSVSTEVSTAVPTYISDGPEMMFRFVTQDNVLKEISEKTFKNVNHAMLDQVKGISSLMKYFVLICKLPSLENVSILDTPGFSSSRPDDTARTLAVINECDALFWVMDCNMGDVNQTSIDLIRNHLKKPLYIIVNKVDTISEQSAAMVERQVGETLGKAGIKYEKIIRFSHQMPVSAIMEAVSQVRKIDMRELYPTQLKALLSDMCKTLSEEVSVLQSQSNAFWHAIMWTYKDFAESLSRLQDDCLEIIKLPQYNSRWLHEDNYVMSISEFERLGTILKNLAGDKVSGINDRCAGMIKYVEAYKRADEEYEKKYTCLVNLLKSREYLDALMNRLT